MDAARLLADRYGDVEGLGELMIIDIGGATTDVHSVAEGKSAWNAVNQMGLPEPYVKRTVEGDLGLRFNLDTHYILYAGGCSVRVSLKGPCSL